MGWSGDRNRNFLVQPEALLFISLFLVTCAHSFRQELQKKTKQGLPLVYFKCGSASTLPVYGRSRLQVSIDAFWSKKVWNECSRVAFPSSCINNFIYKEPLKLGVTFLHWGDFFSVAPDARLHVIFSAFHCTSVTLVPSHQHKRPWSYQDSATVSACGVLWSWNKPCLSVIFTFSLSFSPPLNHER